MICESCKFNGETELQEAKEYPIKYNCEICGVFCIQYVAIEGCCFRKKGENVKC